MARKRFTSKQDVAKPWQIGQLEAKEGAPEIAAHIAVIPMQSYGRLEARHRHKNGYYSSCR
ncbi:MAG: hypothetical protein OEV35_08040 [Gallionellaceae bacterium]|nr:hypothetical protein [Gallionellaceae bacterium]